MLFLETPVEIRPFALLPTSEHASENFTGHHGRGYLKVWSLFTAYIAKDLVNNYAYTPIIVENVNLPFIFHVFFQKI